MGGAVHGRGVAPDLLSVGRTMLRDSPGVAIRGTLTPEWRMVRRALCDGSEPAHDDGARLLGTHERCRPRDTAFLNATAAMALELDDGYSPGGVHPSPPTLPAVLASVAEDSDVSYERFLAAYLVGCEVVCRVARAAHPLSMDRGFHITPVAGVFGAVVGSALIRGVDADTIRRALGLAGSFAGGLYEFVADGASVKRVHAGKPASDGMLCIELALAGLAGPDTVFEGANGLVAAFSGG